MNDVWRATYRLQLRGGVGFNEAAALVPYLARLGISHLYLSPVSRARAGSTHGYDVVDPNEPDPALGGPAAFATLTDRLRAHGLGLVLDIVPNHMAASIENPWWRSVLEEGPASPHAAWFDIDWQDAAGRPQPLELPVLGGELAEILTAGELALELVGPERAIELDYHGSRFPIAPATLKLIDPALPELLAAEPLDGPAIEARLAAAAAPERLAPLLEAQAYRLVFWRDGLRRLRYRRFFDIAELAGVRMEEPGVFAAGHQFVEDLLRGGDVDGLRLDHIDGLADPAAYLDELAGLIGRTAPGRSVRVHVEKILGPGEELRTTWPVDGTTGYEFLNRAMAAFVSPDGLERLAQAYGRLADDHRPFAVVALEAKRQVLAELFPAEVERVVAAGLRAADAAGVVIEPDALRAALIELILALDVYRTYLQGGVAAAEDREVLAAIAGRVPADGTTVAAATIATAMTLLTGSSEAAQRLAARFQQLSGPVMAKALEDTAFYRWHRLVALNEVGGEPGHPPSSPDGFHAFNAGRAARYPMSLLAGATHDTKRGEDVRGRLLVLSEDAAAFEAEVQGWFSLNAPLRRDVDGGQAPDPRTEYLFYQTLIGIWPPRLGSDDASGLGELAERLIVYLRKAMREAKERTRWTAVDEPFEAGVEAFVRAALSPTDSGPFLARVAAYAERIAAAGIVNSLSLTLLRLTSPGVPDVYQGTELWDWSLVDPDNRRPVDFARRLALLDDARPLSARLGGWADGAIKFGLVQRGLAARQEMPELFTHGRYLPLAAEGADAARLLAFARLGEAGAMAITVVPRLTADRIIGREVPLPEPAAWGGTRIILPPEFAGALLVDRLGDLGELRPRGSLLVRELLASLPVALLCGRLG